MNYFFRRWTTNANANGPKSPTADPKPSRRNFGRVGSLQHIRHRHVDVENDGLNKRPASEENLSTRQEHSNEFRTPTRLTAPDKYDEQKPMPPPSPAVDDEEPSSSPAVGGTEDGELQPKLSKSKSSKGKRKSSRRNREREREHEHRHHHHHHERRERREREGREDDAKLLVELNKLLDTLTSRELQLSLRVDKAEEAVRTALAKKSRGDVELTRKRALCALKQKRTLERSLSVTTAQSDRVLRLLGHNVLTPLSERIEASAVRAKNGVEAAQLDATAISSAVKNNFDECDDEQILREIDATIAADLAEENGDAAIRVSPAGSVDWLAEVREQYAKKQESPERDEIPQRVEPASFDPTADDFETVPEVSFEKPRPSREKRPPAHQKSAEKNTRLPSTPSFSRRRRK